MIVNFPYCTQYLPDPPESDSDYGTDSDDACSSTSSFSPYLGMSFHRSSHRRRDTLPPGTATTENGRQVVVKSTDMTEAMQKEAIQVAVQAIERFKIEKDIAAWIKEEFDRRHLPSWHCVVGRNFGSYVTHETNHFIYFYVQHIAVMLFKTGF